MHKLFRKSFAVIGGVLGAVALTAMGTTPAAAQSETPSSPEAVLVVQAAASCPVGYLCVWTDSPFRGSFGTFASGTPDLSTIGNGSLDRAITDVWNHSTNKQFCLWDQKGNKGNSLTIPRTSQGYYVGSSWNDRARSISRC